MAKKRRTVERRAEAERRNKERREEKLAWNRKVQHAKCHLAGAKDWRDPTGKAEFVAELFGNKVPDYLWYEFDGLSAEETGQVCSFFWNGRPNFGDIEGHKMLRIRNGWHFTALLLGKYPLEQIGHAQFWETIDEDGFPTGTVLFSLKGFYENTPAESVSVA